MTRVILYKVDFKIEKNPLIDDLGQYLLNLETKKELKNFQFVKNDLNIEIKVAESQELLNNFPYNYAEIQNDGEPSYYYYIMGTNWLSKSALSLILSMDTVNTLAINNNLRPESFTSETSISREHQDRFFNTPISSGVYLRKIDRESEGMSLINEKCVDTAALDKRFGSEDWFLMFKTREGLSVDNPNNPLGIYLIPEKLEEINKPSVGDVLMNYNNLVVGRNYYFTNRKNTNGVVEIPVPPQVVRYQLGVTTKPGESNQVIQYLIFNTFTNDKKIHVYYVWKDKTNNQLILEDKIDQVEFIRFKRGSLLQYGGEFVSNKGEDEIDKVATLIEPINANTDKTLIKNIESVDRTDSKILKLFRLPYCPIEITKDAFGIVLPPKWISSEGLIKYSGYDLPKLKRGIAFDIDLSSDLEVPLRNMTDHDIKDIENESKLYHSEFTTLKLVYGNDTHNLGLENIRLNPDLSEPVIYVSYQPTNTGNSDMLFTLDYSDCGHLIPQADYEQFFLTTPINEETILSSDYVNYIRNGYNYDKQSQKLAIQQSAVNAVISAADASFRSGSQIARSRKVRKAAFDEAMEPLKEELLQPSLLSISERLTSTDFIQRASKAAKGAVTKAALPYQGLVTQQILNTVSSAATALTNIYFTSQNQKNQMAAKQANLQAQAVNLTGGGSVDLMKEMTNNKVHIMKYELRSEWKQNVYDYFDMFGYSHPYTETPNVSSRIWYNYIQCDPKLRPADTYKIPESWVEDLKTRYNAGVSVFHARNFKYDFKQEYENWETSLLN